MPKALAAGVNNKTQSTTKHNNNDNTQRTLADQVSAWTVLTLVIMPLV